MYNWNYLIDKHLHAKRDNNIYLACDRSDYTDATEGDLDRPKCPRCLDAIYKQATQNGA